MSSKEGSQSVWRAGARGAPAVIAALESAYPGLPNAYLAQMREDDGAEGDLAVEPAWIALWPAADVGRHNAVDKVLGFGFLNALLPFDQHILLVSGRASFEIMQKALAARVPIVAAVSAPSSLAVQFATESGQTLVGFLRGERMNVYSLPERIQF